MLLRQVGVLLGVLDSDIIVREISAFNEHRWGMRIINWTDQLKKKEKRFLILARLVKHYSMQWVTMFLLFSSPLLPPAQYSFGLPGVRRAGAPSSVRPQCCTWPSQQTAQTEEWLSHLQGPTSGHSQWVPDKSLLQKDRHSKRGEDIDLLLVVLKILNNDCKLGFWIIIRL